MIFWYHDIIIFYLISPLIVNCEFKLQKINLYSKICNFKSRSLDWWCHFVSFYGYECSTYIEYMLYTFTMIFYPLPFSNTSHLSCIIPQQLCHTSFHIPILHLHIITNNPPLFQCLISISVVNSHFIKFYTSKLHRIPITNFRTVPPNRLVSRSVL